MSQMTQEKERFAQVIETCDETILYFIIEGLGGASWRLRHDAYKSYTSDSAAAAMLRDASAIHQDLKRAVQQTRRFGVERPIEEDGRATAEYWQWFRWWDAWHKGIPQELWEEIDRKMWNEEDVSAYRPEGDWRRSS